jgi:SpoVK/Ycf46/Vps4 family AAA+-type ATPase
MSNDQNDSNKTNIDEIENLTEPQKKRIRLFFKNSNELDVNFEYTQQQAKFMCDNTLCDHKKYFPKWYESNKITIIEINTLNDLINLGANYHCRMRRNFNGIDLKVLFGITDYLKELNNMIGLQNIKEEIVNMIIYLLILKNSSKKLNSDMLHSVITGLPGCGKTTFIEILAKIYTKLGLLKKGHIIKAKRSDLIAKYLGQTAIQTQKKIDEAKGGILLIDEAYSLGNAEGRDSFSKECIDTLNQALSEDKGEFICIIAGYKDALDLCFFNYNEGLRRRFPFRFNIKEYSYEELSRILMKKIVEYDYWILEFEQNDLNKLIKENFKYFENQGGDMETLFLNLKIIHNKRVFLLPVIEKTKLTIKDISNSINKFINYKGDKFKYEIPMGLYV